MPVFCTFVKGCPINDSVVFDTIKVRSHQKLNYFFARPNPMKSQRTDACGCDRRDIFQGGAFGATRCGRRVDSGAFSSGAIFDPS